MIDLHIHTNVSDGQYSPAETVLHAVSKGAKCIAITDHDRISGLEEAEDTAKNAGVEFIPGIEISVMGNRELHILGYYLDYTNPRLLEACDEYMRLREQRSGRIFEYLRQKGIPLGEEQVQKHVLNGIAGRPHFARAMVEASYVGSVQEAFDKYLGTPEFDKVERTKPTAREGINMILDAGGVPVLAHPALLKLDNWNLESLVERLTGDGLMGIECYYSTHTAEQTVQYLRHAERFGLLVTCGSDYHGENNKPGVDIGSGTDFLTEQETEGILKDLRSRGKI
jgi:hypothetical protein